VSNNLDTVANMVLGRESAEPPTSRWCSSVASFDNKRSTPHEAVSAIIGRVDHDDQSFRQAAGAQPA
jgi:hypothetical protein